MALGGGWVSMTTTKLDGRSMADAMPAAYDTLESDLVKRALMEALASPGIGLGGGTAALARELTELEALLREEGPEASSAYELALLGNMRAQLAEREQRSV